MSPRHRRLYTTTAALIAIDLFFGALVLVPIRAKIAGGIYQTGLSRPTFGESSESATGSIGVLGARVTVNIPPLPIAQRVRFERSVTLIQNGETVALGVISPTPKTHYLFPWQRESLTAEIEVLAGPDGSRPTVDPTVPLTIELRGRAGARTFVARGVIREPGSP